MSIYPMTDIPKWVRIRYINKSLRFSELIGIKNFILYLKIKYKMLTVLKNTETDTAEIQTQQTVETYIKCSYS